MAASSWLPASSGPQPSGTSVWVVWTGGTAGTRRYAGSNVAEPVTITSQIFGGPTGVMVTVVPAPALAYASNPSVTPIAGPPAPARVPAWQTSSPYWRAGLQTAAALSEGATPQCPDGYVLRSDGSNWYCVPAPVSNQPAHTRGSTGEKIKSTLKNIMNPMRLLMAHETTHVSRQHNPSDCSDANTPADQCKWICLPMPSPNDPHDEHCVRVPKNARLRGSYFTATPGVRRTFVQRIKDRFVR